MQIAKAMRIVFFTICFLLAMTVRSQTAAGFEARPLTQAETFPAKGTYQIVLKPGMDKIDIPAEFLLKIENKREQNNIVYLTYKEGIKIRIFSKNEIQAPGFQPHEEYVYEE
jgi:hypothetical protein